ncbi:MAG: penicillin acylase family protein [Alphaproteobacteria bacterium]|nr:penicillin acylase family protein [Alphaproteobacteria bacterium]
MTAGAETVELTGLEAPVEILIDRWGLAHIYAQSTRDCFFAQGWNAARDRLWQIDLWRKRGLGLLAGDFGPAYLDQDRAARRFLYRGDMTPEWAAYGAEAEAWTEAFVAGINAYVDGLAEAPERLPPEFKLMGTAPARWRAEDVVRIRSHARVHNLDQEVRRSAVLAKYGSEADQLRKRLQPEWEIRPPYGLAPEEIPAEVMQAYLLGTEPPAFGPDRLASPLQPPPPELAGSNAWAVAPERSETGRALFATDPHRLHGLPALRYMVHLSAPGLDVIGAGEPAVPGVSLGHNERLAFGLTIWPVDQEDLYVYELHPDDPSRYRYEGGWEAMETVIETVPVRGRADEEVELAFTRHGPVLHADPETGRAYALRTVWREPGTAAYLASLSFLQARNWEDYLEALQGWGAPSTNHIVADVDGNIGWATAGMVPRRPNWDGLMPVPGDGRFEWYGFLPPEEKPRSFNPAAGWVASANQFNLPDDFDWRRHRVGFEWPDPARYRLIARGLEAKPTHSLDDMAALQTSFFSLPAERLTALLAGLDADDPRLREALALLAAWDQRLEADSGAAALFEIWFVRHLLPATLAAVSPEGLQAFAAVPDTELALDLVEADDPRLAGGRAALLTETLLRAWDETADRLGHTPEAWAWGRLHHGYFEHPLSPLVDASAGQRLDVGPAPKGGNGMTINNNAYRPDDFRVSLGVSWRMLADVGNWDACRTINAPGQSGDPTSPHYRDHFPLWAREDYVPMPYSREAVEAATEHRLLLRAK